MDGKQLQVQETQQILSNALLALLKVKPYSSISVNDILSQSQISRRTFYRHFRNKNHLLHFYFRELMQEYLIQKETLITEKDPYQALLASFKFWYSKRKSLKLVIDNQLFEPFIAHWNDNAQAISEKFYDSDDLNEGIYSLRFFIGGYCNALWIWLGKEKPETPEAMARYFLNILSSLDFKNTAQ